MAAVNLMNPCTLLLLLVVAMISSVAATDYTVGDSSNWDLGVDYDSWASKYTFVVGDRLVFKWTSNHDVVVVSSSEYSACTSSSSDTKYSSSPVTVSLTSAGTNYYICSVTGHCSGGMKLQVTVAAASNSSTNSSSSSSTSPSSSTNSSTNSSSTSSGTDSSSTANSTTPNSSARLQMLPSLLSVLVALALSLAATYLPF